MFFSNSIGMSPFAACHACDLVQLLVGEKISNATNAMAQ